MSNTTPNPTVVATKAPAQVFDASSLPAYGVDANISSVLVGLRHRRPTAIPRLVVTLLVGVAVQQVARRALAQVAEEARKVLPPLRTDGDTFATPVIEVLVRRAITSREHTAPRTVSVGTSATSESVRHYSFYMGAPAGPRWLVCNGEAVVWSCPCIATVADADRRSSESAIAAWDRRSIRDDLQLSKSASDERYSSRHNVAFSALCSAVGDRQQPALTAIIY